MAKAKDETLEHLRSKIREMMNDTADHMIAGGCDDYAQYRNCVGHIGGLAKAERELLDIDDMLHRSDDT